MQLDLYMFILNTEYGADSSASNGLNAVADRFLGERKEDIPYTQINELQDGDSETRHRLAVYCQKARRSISRPRQRN